MKTSFGEYFDDQRDRIVKDMQTGKNTELINAWREDFDKRQNAKVLPQEEVNTDILQNEENWENEGGSGGVALPYVDDNTPREELDSWVKTTAKATAKGIGAKEDTQQLFWWESIGT